MKNTVIWLYVVTYRPEYKTEITIYLVFSSSSTSYHNHHYHLILYFSSSTSQNTPTTYFKFPSLILVFFYFLPFSPKKSRSSTIPHKFFYKSLEHFSSRKMQQCSVWTPQYSLHSDESKCISTSYILLRFLLDKMQCSYPEKMSHLSHKKTCNSCQT